MINPQSQKTLFYKTEPMVSVPSPSPARLFPDGTGAQAMGERLCLTGHTGEKHVLQWSSLARPYFEWNIYLPPQSQLALGRSTSLAGGCPLSTRAPDVSVSPTSPPALSSAPELSPHSMTTRGYWGRLGTVGVGSLHPHLVLSEQGSHLKAPLSHGPVCRNCMQNCVTRCI